MLRTGSALVALTTASAMAVRYAPQAATHSATSSVVADYTRIACETVVNAPLAEAWRCWATSEGAESYFAPHAEIEPVPGGSFEIWFNPAGEPGTRGAEGMKVLSALPGEMISFEWNAPPRFAHARPQKTWVVVTFTAVDEAHTRVRLVHLGWDEMKARNPGHAQEWDDVRGYFEDAWPLVLSWMKRRFDVGPRWAADGSALWNE